jgi:hypothetical protein
LVIIGTVATGVVIVSSIGLDSVAVGGQGDEHAGTVAVKCCELGFGAEASAPGSFGGAAVSDSVARFDSLARNWLSLFVSSCCSDSSMPRILRYLAASRSVMCLPRAEVAAVGWLSKTVVTTLDVAARIGTVVVKQVGCAR